MTPTSISGEWQVGIGGSSIFHLIYAMLGCAEIHYQLKLIVNLVPRLARSLELEHIFFSCYIKNLINIL